MSELPCLPDGRAAASHMHCASGLLTAHIGRVPGTATAPRADSVRAVNVAHVQHWLRQRHRRRHRCCSCLIATKYLYCGTQGGQSEAVLMTNVALLVRPLRLVGAVTTRVLVDAAIAALDNRFCERTAENRNLIGSWEISAVHESGCSCSRITLAEGDIPMRVRSERRECTRPTKY